MVVHLLLLRVVSFSSFVKYVLLALLILYEIAVSGIEDYPDFLECMKFMHVFPRNRQQWLDILNQPIAKSSIGFQDLKFSVRGFSAKRMALLLNGVQLWLFLADFMDTYYDYGLGVNVGSLLLVLINLFLGFFCPRNDKSRFFPFALAVILFVLTNLCMPL